MFTQRLAELRKQKGLKQKEIAEALSLSAARYSQYESGKRAPDIGTLKRIADYHKVSLDYLVGRTNIPSATLQVLKAAGGDVEIEATRNISTSDAIRLLITLLEQQEKDA